MPPVRVLSIHADYRCRHTGACCTSNWPIPVEADRHSRLVAAMATGELRASAGHAFEAPETTSDTPAVLATDGTRCVFHEPEGRCAIHSALGHEALPLACRQFPRVSVTDPRGVSVTLSHYCPTAAAMLARDDAVIIATDAPAFPSTGEYVGLDARTALPPLLRPGMLMDWESWWECERLAVDLLANSDHSVATALARLRHAVTQISAWIPSDGQLIDRVHAAFENPGTKVPGLQQSSLVDAVFGAIPTELRPARFPVAESTDNAVARRFLAAHAFANWTMHLGRGLETWLRSIEAAAALLDAGAGVRQADLLLRHLAQPKQLAANLSQIDR